MKLYYFPTPNPQKVKFALLELGLDCEMVTVDLAKGAHREPAFLALNPFGRVPVLVDGDLTLWESHAMLAYLGEMTGRLWPSAPAGRADALRWLFFLSQHMMTAAGEVALPLRSKLSGVPYDEADVARGRKVLANALPVVEGELARHRWMLGEGFSLVDCAYGPVFNVAEKAGFDFAQYPRITAYLDTIRQRPAWRETPVLPGLR
jgi:glutathione S-transferase